MCYRIFTKPEHSHEWIKAAEFGTASIALEQLDFLTASQPHRPGKWVVRNLRGEVIARATVAAPPQASTYWAQPAQLQPA